jgi:hypothetical protein
MSRSVRVAWVWVSARSAQPRILQDPPPALRGDLPLLGDPIELVARQVRFLLPLGRETELSTCYQVDPLRLERTVVDV